MFIYLKCSKNVKQEKHLENLFLAYFPYILSENFEYTSESRRTNQPVNFKTTIFFYFSLIDFYLIIDKWQHNKFVIMQTMLFSSSRIDPGELVLTFWVHAKHVKYEERFTNKTERFDFYGARGRPEAFAYHSPKFQNGRQVKLDLFLFYAMFSLLNFVKFRNYKTFFGFVYKLFRLFAAVFAESFVSVWISELWVLRKWQLVQVKAEWKQLLLN